MRREWKWEWYAWLDLNEGAALCGMCFLTSQSFWHSSDAGIDPWLELFWEKVVSLYPSLADVTPLREDEQWVPIWFLCVAHFDWKIVSFKSSLLTTVWILHMCCSLWGRLPPTYTFHFLDDVEEKTEDRPRITMEQTVSSQSNPFPAAMVSNRRVTELSHYQDVRLIEFDITGSNIE